MLSSGVYRLNNESYSQCSGTGTANTMLLVFIIPLAVAVLAGEAPLTPKGALLVLPAQENSTTPTSTTDAPRNDDKQNLESVNDVITKRLRQEAGSERGVYHVYLPDGGLQRVEYTTAPVKVQPGQNQVNGTTNGTTQAQNSTSTSAAPRGLYYVQVPADRLKQLLANQQPKDEQRNQQSSQAQQTGRAIPDNQRADQLSSYFLPLLVLTTDQFVQSRAAQQAGNSDVTIKVDQTASDQDQSSPDQNQTSDNQIPTGQQAAASSQPSAYLASVQYTEVKPITGPIYSYSPGQLVRIARYADIK